jgi:hypothetical protein
LNRKTVISALDRLEACGLIADSGRRTGSTKQVKVYIINVGKESQKRNSSENGRKESQKRNTEPVNNLSSEAKASSVSAKPRKAEVAAGFLAFWQAYPKKVGKQEAIRAWSRINGKRPDLETLLAKIEELKTCEQWTKDGGRFVPNPATWLNRGGWDDELPKSYTDQIPGFYWSKPNE